MSLRVNKAKKFNGKAYVATDELDSLLQAMALSGNTLTIVGAEKTVEGDAVTAKSLDLSGLVTIANNTTSIKGTTTSMVTVANNQIDATNLMGFIGNTSASRIVSTDANGKLAYGDTKVTTIGDSPTATQIPTASAVKNYVDNHSIGLTSTDSSVTITGDLTKDLATNLYIKKQTTADTGYAATYQLQIGNGAGATAIGDKIQILKDQFLKAVEFIASATNADVTAAGGQGTAGFAEGEPVIKFTMELTGTDSDTDSYLYVPVKSLVDVYTAGNGIDTITSNIIKVKVDTSTEKVYTDKGTSAAVLSVGANGVKTANVQAAIDNAVNAEHAAASAAISAVNANVEAFEGSVNTAISSVVTNANAAISATTSSINSRVSAAITSTNTNVSSVITGVGTAITTTTTNINSSVNAAVTKAVELEETTYTFGTSPATITSGVASITGVTGNVLAVFDSATGDQVYPDIRKSGSGTAATNTLEADYGSADTTGLKWIVLHTKAITYTNATAGSVTAYTKAQYTNGTKSDVAAATAASYDDSAAEGALDYK